MNFYAYFDAYYDDNEDDSASDYELLEQFYIEEWEDTQSDD